MLLLQGASVQSLVRELDPRCLVVQQTNKEINETKHSSFLDLRIRLSLLHLLESFSQFLHVLVLKQILVNFRQWFLGPAAPMSLGENQTCLIIQLSPSPLSNVLAQKPSSVDSRGTGSEVSVTSPFLVHFSSVAQLCPTLCDPMDCSTPGVPVHHQLLEFSQTHVHRVDDAIRPSFYLKVTLLACLLFLTSFPPCLTGFF